MAYRRYPARRSSQRRRKSYRSRAIALFRRRRYPARRLRRSRPRVSRRRILQVASRKKFDTQLGSTSSVPTVPTQLQLRIGATYVLSCPTFLPAPVEGIVNEEGRYRRARQEVFFRGVSERIFWTTAVHMTWRRIVFYSHERIEVARPITVTNPNTNNPFLRRNLAEFLPGVGQPDADIGEALWQGTSGIDYTEDTRMYSRLDPQRVQVVYDRSVDLNPNYKMWDGTQPVPATLGKHRSRKLWHPVNRNMTYVQDEDGGDKMVPTATNGWATRSPQSGGNLYIMDIFHTGFGGSQPDDQKCGKFGLESTVYWHER